MEDFRMDEKLKTAIAEVEKRFESLKARGIELGEKRSEIDKEIGAVNAEILKVQGEYRALVALKGESTETVQ